MDFVFEFVFGFIFEFVLSIVGEALVELGYDSLAKRLSGRTWNAIFMAAAYLIFGFILGALSLLVFPRVVFGNRIIPLLYFIISPILAGFLLCFVAWLINRAFCPAKFFQLNKFIRGASFVFAFSIARYALA